MREAEVEDSNKGKGKGNGKIGWLISNFQMRKDARANEIDALKKAKAVLLAVLKCLFFDCVSEHLLSPIGMHHIYLRILYVFTQS